MSIFDSRALLYALAVVAVAVTDVEEVAPLDKTGNSSTGACACCSARLRNELGLAGGAAAVGSSGTVRGLDVVVVVVDELKNLFFLAAPGNILLLYFLFLFLFILSKCLYGLPEYK